INHRKLKSAVLFIRAKKMQRRQEMRKNPVENPKVPDIHAVADEADISDSSIDQKPDRMNRQRPCDKNESDAKSDLQRNPAYHQQSRQKQKESPLFFTDAFEPGGSGRLSKEDKVKHESHAEHGKLGGKRPEDEFADEIAPTRGKMMPEQMDCQRSTKSNGQRAEKRRPHR